MEDTKPPVSDSESDSGDSSDDENDGYLLSISKASNNKITLQTTLYKLLQSCVYQPLRSAVFQNPLMCFYAAFTVRESSYVRASAYTSFLAKVL